MEKKTARLMHIFTIMLLLIIGFSIDTFGEPFASYQELAYRYAPIHHQDVDVTGFNSLSGVSDYISRIDYDGDWRTNNNWDNLPAYIDAGGHALFTSHVYYSVVETNSHFFITYAFYHPRDWADFLFDTEHENDLEGFLAIIRKENAPYGVLDGIITVFHTDFYSYVPAGSPLEGNTQDIDGTLTLENGRPVTAQQAKGHGLKAWPYVDIEGGDGIVYRPSQSITQAPEDNYDQNVPYTLIDIFENGGLWQRRNNTETFAKWGALWGDKSGTCGTPCPCSENSANTPWNWDDGNDGGSLPGEMATDPVNLCRLYFRYTNGYAFNGTYLYNPYRGIDRVQHAVSGSNISGAVARPLDPLGATPLLRSFDFDFQNGDHHIKEIKALISNENAYIDYQDKNADDPYYYYLSYEYRDNLPVYTITGDNNTGTTVRNLAAKPGPDYVFAITGFQFHFNNDDHHIKKMALYESNSILTVIYEDKNYDDAYNWQVQYTYLPPELVNTYGRVSGHNAGGDYKPVSDTSPKVLKGFYFNFTNNDHHIDQVAVSLGDDEINARYNDKNNDDLFDWFVDYVGLK